MGIIAGRLTELILFIAACLDRRVDEIALFNAYAVGSVDEVGQAAGSALLLAIDIYVQFCIWQIARCGAK